VLGHVVRFDYSQVPVHGDTDHVSLLTTNAIARWLAHQLELNQGLAEEEPHRILAFASWPSPNPTNMPGWQTTPSRQRRPFTI